VLRPSITPELLNCVFMRDIKKLLLHVIKENGDDPNDVECTYGTGFPFYIQDVDSTQKCLASELPDGELSVLICHSEKHRYELVKRGKRPRITAALKAWQDVRD